MNPDTFLGASEEDYYFLSQSEKTDESRLKKKKKRTPDAERPEDFYKSREIQSQVHAVDLIWLQSPADLPKGRPPPQLPRANSIQMEGEFFSLTFIILKYNSLIYFINYKQQ